MPVAPYAEVRRPGRPATMKSSVRLPLNNDREEKSVRFESRRALQTIQMNEIKAAASSPARKRSSLGAKDAASPRTPNNDDKENDQSQGLTVVSGNAVTPMKRVPILANFEEWMKMATDNKINAANSWNFALIDYFHDMSLLREGDSVNFQKASCTLDGCVKIYTSRVDSVATETGKLLSGLADSGNKKSRGDAETDGQDNDEEEEEGEDGVKRKIKKRVQRSSEATLASSFSQLQLKKMELEFAVDPLFKKASADFDQGGAKGLLLNHLTIDSSGRIVFDSSGDASDQSKHDQEDLEADTSMAPAQLDAPIDLISLAQRFFPDLSNLEQQDICPSLKTFELGGATESMDIPFLKAGDDWKKDRDGPSGETDLISHDIAPPGMDDDDDVAMGGFDMGPDVGFGEGGEAWANNAAIDTQVQPSEVPFEVGGDEDARGQVGDFDAESAHYGIKLNQGEPDQENILSYFDQALHKNWAGPEHWRIRKLKDASKTSAPQRQRKEKEPFLIDFSAPLSKAVSDLLYTPASSSSVISLPKSQWKSKTRNLLPDDKHFNSKQLLRLFLKPKARIGSRRAESSQRSTQADLPEGEMDEGFWARRHEISISNVDQDVRGDYDANFFQDDGLGLPGGGMEDDDEFADARETFSPGAEGALLGTAQSLEVMLATNSQQDGFGSQLVTQSRRFRPEYVQYARVAKKVDVRRLKEEMWRNSGLALDNVDCLLLPIILRSLLTCLQVPSTFEQSPQPSTPLQLKDPSIPLKFTSVMNSLQSVYPKQAMADISTSYCFICLLHLANEKGLTLEHDRTFEEITIQKDLTAVITEGGD